MTIRRRERAYSALVSYPQRTWDVPEKFNLHLRFRVAHNHISIHLSLVKTLIILLNRHLE